MKKIFLCFISLTFFIFLCVSSTDVKALDSDEEVNRAFSQKAQAVSVSHFSLHMGDKEGRPPSPFILESKSIHVLRIRNLDSALLLKGLARGSLMNANFRNVHTLDLSGYQGKKSDFEEVLQSLSCQMVSLQKVLFPLESI